MQLIGVHAVESAIEAGRPIERVLVARGAKNLRLARIIEECRRRKIPLRFEPRVLLDRMARGGAHQGVAAIAAETGERRLEEVIRPAGESGVLLVAAGVEDPRNLGAIIRSAYAAGADAIVVPRRRAAGLTETVAKAASGALELLPVVRTSNVNRALEEIKKAGYWAYGLDERGERTCFETDLSGRVALVVGGEGAGLSPLTARRCDALIRIPTVGRIASLNVSAAAAVALFEALRQRLAAGETGDAGG